MISEIPKALLNLPQEAGSILEQSELESHELFFKAPLKDNTYATEWVVFGAKGGATVVFPA